MTAMPAPAGAQNDARLRALGTGTPLLLISGGGTPHDNAINHLDNVLWIGGLWQAHAGPVWALVSDGSDPAPDASRLVVSEPEAADWWLQRLIMRTDAVLAFTSSTTPWTFGPATRQALRAWVDGPGRTLAAGTVLNIYVTDHGIRNGASSEIVLWGETLSPAALAAELDRLPQDVGVRLLMAQCYSGGFVDTVAALLERDRVACGFFAAPPDRVAAGCSHAPQDYAEYSTPIFESLFATQRLPGATAAAPAQTFVQAHIAALQALTSADTPQLSRTAFLPPQGVGGLSPTLAQALIAYLDRLPPLALPGSDSEIAELQSRYSGLLDALSSTEAQLEADLLNRFPELLYPFVPQLAQHVQTQREDLAVFIARHTGIRDWRRYAAELATVETRLAALEAAEAALLRRAELERLAQGWNEGRRLTQARWDRLRACEAAPVPRR